MTDHPTNEARSTGSSDPVLVLTRFRPDVHHDAEWDADRRDAVLAGILAAGPTCTHVGWASSHRRFVAAGAVAVAASAAVLTAGLVLPGGSRGGPDAAAAATLDRLAVTAGTAGRDVGPGQYAYGDAREVQRFSAADVEHGTPAITRHTFRTWTARSGDAWRLRGDCLQHLPYDDLDTPAGGTYGGLNSSALAMLPSTPDELARYLDAHPEGDNRGTLNRFLGVGDLVNDGLATPALRSAAIRLLADTDGVTVDPKSQDALGRDAIEVDFDYQDDRDTVSSLYFSPSTSTLLETQMRQDGSVDYRSVERMSQVVDSLPDRPACS